MSYIEIDSGILEVKLEAAYKRFMDLRKTNIEVSQKHIANEFNGRIMHKILKFLRLDHDIKPENITEKGLYGYWEALDFMFAKYSFDDQLKRINVLLRMCHLASTVHLSVEDANLL